MKWPGLYILLLTAVFMVCKSTPVPVMETLAVEEVPAINETEFTAADPVVITQEVYDSTLAEVKVFIDNLNSLIYNKNYSGWKDALSDNFYANISSPEFLANASESTVLRTRKIVLRTPEDYFLQVVVPSRSNSRVDEIEFTSENTVKVYYLERTRRNDNAPTAEPRRLRLYELVKSENEWKIID